MKEHLPEAPRRVAEDDGCRTTRAASCESAGVAKPRPPWRASLSIRGAIVLVLGFAATGLAQEIVPAPLQAALFKRILEYDRTLKSHVGDDIVLGIVANPGDKSSTKAAAEVQQAFKAIAATEKVQGLALKVVTHTFRSPAEVEAWVKQEGVDVLYLTPGLSHVAADLTALATQHKIISISSVRKDVEQGIALGVTIRGETPRILVNLKAAQAAGMELDAKLLQLSEVLR